MASEFLDANFVLRYITQDAPDQSRKARAVIEQIAQGARTVTTSESVISEVVHVLSSKILYNLPRRDIRLHLITIINLSGLKLPNKKTYLRALDLFASSNLDFVDALNVAQMERMGISVILSFDRDFDKVSGITRREE